VSKGTTSEAELHILKARMLEGKRAKRRGRTGDAAAERLCAPGEVALGPDAQAQGTIRLVFELFE
jgi:hypothetical protein